MHINLKITILFIILSVIYIIYIKIFDNKLVINNRITVILFSEDWCKTCKEQEPIYTSVKKKFPNIIFYKVPENYKRFLLKKKYNIVSLPTILIYKDSIEVDRIIGKYSASELETSIITNTLAEIRK